MHVTAVYRHVSIFEFCIFAELPMVKPFVIGIWAGESKPDLNEYLLPLVTELQTILSSGIYINTHHVTFKLGQIICDTPARAYIKGNCLQRVKKINFVKLNSINHFVYSINIFMVFNTGSVLFNHKNGCQKCFSIGQFSSEYRRISYPVLNAAKRTDESFRERLQPKHHKENSLIEHLGVDMILDFPTSDPLHLLELGVMRRCMYRWVFGYKGYKSKWSKPLIGLTSRLLISCQPHMPSDFHRAVRRLDSLKHWKGVEYRTILLYLGVVVFKQVQTLTRIWVSID